MKKTNIFFACALVAIASLFALSCQREEMMPTDKQQEEEVVSASGKQITITATIPDNPESRVAFEQATGKVKLTWETNDKIIVVDEANVMDKQTFTLSSGAGETTATFTGTEPANTNSTYTIFYAGNTEAYTTTDAVNNKSYADQVQVGNGNTDHLAFTAMLTGVDAYDHFVFSADWASSHSGNLVINSIYKFYFKLPAAVTSVSEVRLNAPAAIFYTTNSNGSTTSEIGVSLLGVDVSTSEQVLTAYAMASDETVSMAAATYTVTVVGTSNSWVKQFTTASAGTFGGGKTHVIQLNDSNWAELPGKGTESAPFLLDTPEELQMISPLLVINGAKRYFKMGGDITFDATKSAAYVPVANFFNAEFDGNKASYAIKSYTGSKPLFTSVASGAKVHDVSLDSNCNLTIASPAPDAKHAPLVGTNSGDVKDCNSSAAVTINNIQDVTTASQYYGGLVAHNVGGTIDGCTVQNSISCSQTGQTITTNPTYIGGVAGLVDEGTINNCEFTGDITISDGNTYGGITANDLYFYVGGITGRVEKGRITYCTAGINGTPKAIDLRGKMVPAIGGIVGWEVTATDSEISNCKNYMSLSFASDGARANTTPCRIGGIASRSAAAISKSNNYGSISSTCNSTTLNLGGIVAEGANVSDCTNESSGTISRSNADQTADQANRYMYIGGIMGQPQAACDIKDCTNHGSVTNNVIGTATNSTLDMGGILGSAAKQVDVSGCTNDAEIKFDNDNASAVASARNAIGGIVGNVTTANTTVTGSSNSGKVWCKYNASGSYGPTSIGGIIGHASAAFSVTNCSNLVSEGSMILCQNAGVAAAMTIDLGGIVGCAEGKATISGKKEGAAATNTQEVKMDNDNASAVAIARTSLGGIVGYSSVAESSVSSCGNTGKIWINNNTAGSYGLMSVGGTVGHTAASSTVQDCTNSGEILCQNPGAAITAYVDLGGIVGYAEATITIKGTTADATLNSGPVTVAQASSAILYARNTEGGILGYGKGNNTKITNCKNSAKIYCNLTGVTANNRPSYTGGIVGLLASLAYTNDAASGLSALSGVEIGNCNNTGEVNSSNYNNRAGNKTAPFAGGIAGLISAKSDSKASIHDCSVGSQTIYAYRAAACGGIIAYANLCTLKDNTCAANMSGMNASVVGVGGIIGRMFDSSMEDCTFSGKIAKAKNIGGLVYSMNEQTTGSSISGCKVNGAELTTGTATDKTAAAVLISVADDKTNTISDCGVKGTLDSATITLESNMITTNGGATVTGTYLIP